MKLKKKHSQIHIYVYIHIYIYVASVPYMTTACSFKCLISTVQQDPANAKLVHALQFLCETPLCPISTQLWNMALQIFGHGPITLRM